MAKDLLTPLRRVSHLARIAGAEDVSRRLFVTNAFDGLLAVLGMVMGMVTVSVDDPLAYVGAGLGVSLVMGVFSGFLGTLMSERAERLRELRHMERVMLANLDNSVYGQAAKYVPLYVALWSCAGVVTFPLVALTPFILCHLGFIGVNEALGASLVLIHSMLFALGAYLGKIGHESPVKSGLRMMGIGLLATLLLAALTLVFRIGVTPL